MGGGKSRAEQFQLPSFKGGLEVYNSNMKPNREFPIKHSESLSVKRGGEAENLEQNNSSNPPLKGV